MIAHVRDQGRVAAPRRRHQRSQPDADQRRQIAARDLRRLVERAVLRRQASQRALLAQPLELFLDVGIGFDRDRVAVGFRRAFDVAARLEQLANLRQRPGVARIERGGFPEMLERRGRVALLPLDAGQLAIEEGAVG